MDSYALEHFILDVERAYPVNEWQVCGIDVWPFLRTDFVLRNLCADVPHATSANNTESSGFDKKHRLRDILSDSTDIMFVLYRASICANNADIYDRFTDCINSYFASNGSKCLTLEFEKNGGICSTRQGRLFSVGDYYSHFFSHPRKRSCAEYSLAGYEDFCRYAVEIFACKQTGIHITKEEELIQTFLGYRNAVELFKLFLQNLKPKLTFEVCYYDIICRVINVACEELRIPTVEIQHGLYHFDAYYQWTKIPETGFDTFPDYFWCWSSYEYRRLSEWIDNKNHRVVVGGNPWINLYNSAKDNHIRSTEDFHRFILTKRSAYCRICVFTCGLELPPIIVDAINKFDDCFWLVRYHPSMGDSVKRAIRACLEEKDNVDLDYSNSIRLYDLFSESDVHITAYSSCVIEAEEMGVCSVTFDKRGVYYYSEKIDSGVLLFAPDLDGMRNAILQQCYKRKKNAPDDCDIAGTCEYLQRCATSRTGVDNNGQSGFDSVETDTFTNELYTQALYCNGEYEVILSAVNKNMYFCKLSQISIAEDVEEKIMLFQQYMAMLSDKKEVSASHDDYCIDYATYVFDILRDSINGLAPVLNSAIYDDMKRTIRVLFDDKDYVRSVGIRDLFINNCFSSVVLFEDIEKTDVFYFLGRSYKTLKRNVEACIYLRKYIDEYDCGENSIVVISDERSYLISALFHLGEVYYFYNNFTESRIFLERCVKMCKPNTHLKAKRYLEIMSGDV